MSLAKTLLFLEDDKDLQMLVGAFLRERGYRVEHARSASEARAILEKMPVDAAIVDGLLPGMTGADFIRELRQAQPTLPILFASAFWKDLKSHEMLTRQLGVARIVHKPYRPEELAVWVDQLFIKTLPALPPPPPPEALESPSKEADPGALDPLAAKMAALNAEYGAKLREKMSHLGELLGRARDEREALEGAYSATHKLHGTAGSYGFAAVSTAAGRLEDALRPAKDGGSADWGQVTVRFQELAAVASTPGKNSVRTDTPVNATLTGEGTLLVVDEDPSVLAEVELLGRAHVVRVVTARTADEARAVLRRQWVDGALIHMNLGAPMGGITAAHALRAEEGHASLPLAFTSSERGLEGRVAAVHAGASLFLARPFSAQDFVSAAERMVAARRQERVRILVVDDDPEAVTALTHALASDSMEVVGLPSAYGLLDALTRHRPDLLLLDVRMPGPNGFDLCRILRSMPEWQELPILLITAQIGTEFRLAAFQAGADDYIPKPVLREELRARVHARVERARMARDRAERDAATGLLLRRPFIEAMRTRLSEAQRQQKPLALCFLDVDHFKRVNDQHGHMAGDRVLMHLGRLLAARFRREDVRARWGGEEFVVALLGENAQSARDILERTAAELSQMRFEGDGGESFHITFSAGIAVAPRDGTTVEELLRVADSRLYRAKANGRDRIET
ncbi:diguanylate cyclase [Corallococcus sp. H22C18031201]|nr:diguanylate cyclase [Corallococcus sp. H22C18031201]